MTERKRYDCQLVSASVVLNFTFYLQIPPTEILLSFEYTIEPDKDNIIEVPSLGEGVIVRFE